MFPGGKTGKNITYAQSWVVKLKEPSLFKVQEVSLLTQTGGSHALHRRWVLEEVGENLETPLQLDQGTMTMIPRFQ